MIVNGILLIYYHPLTESASTVMEHVSSFEKFSEYRVWSINAIYGIPKGIEKLKFSVIVLHYSVFGGPRSLLSKKLLAYIASCGETVKVAFFQDEMHNCQRRFEIINFLSIDIIYSILDSKFHHEVYYKNTTVKRVIPTLTGFVSEDLRSKSDLFFKPFELREIDVGYRARQLPFFMGRGAQEKTEIGNLFKEHSASSGLVIDIETEENKRIHGDDWLVFLAKCRFTLGVESGTSIFDLSGSIEKKVNEYIDDNPNASFHEVEELILNPFEDVINYRAISPRLFECAAMRTCMILFVGEYQGIIKPDIHYIPLRKDFSNYNDVVTKMNNRAYVSGLINRAYEDLIDSKAFEYGEFIKTFDEIIRQSLPPVPSKTVSHHVVTRLFESDQWFRILKANLRHRAFPGRELIKKLLKPKI